MLLNLKRKKMDNKYYTPKVEEFHVGFNYELLILDDIQWWKETIVRKDNRFDCFDDYLNEKRIRIKYLDKEDIESLGFKYTGRTVIQWFSAIGAFYTPGERHRLTEYKLTYDSNNNELKIEGFLQRILKESCLKEL
jgi:hypothetical protein